MREGEQISVWRIATDTPDYTSDDMTGEGARLTGGRWNRKGNAVIYSASSIALACLESLAHLEFGGLPLNRYLVRIDIPKAIWDKRFKFDESKNIGWDASPAGKVSLDAGDDWLAGAKSAVMEVPSVIVPEECNILINPHHNGIKKLRAVKVRKWLFDARLNG